MPVLVSRCCTGIACRYRGNGSFRAVVRELLRKGEEIVTTCPEVDGGLPTPREGCDATRSGRVFGRITGTEYTAEYQRGAELALQLCLDNGITRAYLLRGSPSCGKGYGLTAKLLEEHGIRVVPI
jgi:uncharacterized protein YbbK (DUF523 family)